MRADSTFIASGRGRKSIRIHSRKTYNSGLFLLDLSHMPTGCGTWPAWWLVGPGWPNSGEIDVIEGVHDQNYNQAALHTNAGCSYQNAAVSMSGQWGKGTNGQPAKNCYVHAPGQWNNQGCPVKTTYGSYGAPLNSGGGGVYALLWDRRVGLKMWFFARSAIPSDITGKVPNPNNWGRPFADYTFGSHCPASHFQNHRIIFDLTFCGDWAGATFAGTCGRFGSNCNTFVKNNPRQFTEAYWTVNYVRVYQGSGSPVVQPTVRPPAGGLTAHLSAGATTQWVPLFYGALNNQISYTYLYSTNTQWQLGTLQSGWWIYKATRVGFNTPMTVFFRTKSGVSYMGCNVITSLPANGGQFSGIVQRSACFAASGSANDGAPPGPPGGSSSKTSPKENSPKVNVVVISVICGALCALFLCVSVGCYRSRMMKRSVDGVDEERLLDEHAQTRGVETVS